MIKYLLITIVISFLQYVSLYGQSSRVINITNKAGIKRNDALVVLTKTILEKKLNQKLENKFVQIIYKDQPVFLQFDDINGDSTWDEVVFLSSFKPFEKKHFKLFASKVPTTIKPVVKAYVRQKHLLSDGTFSSNILVDTMPFSNKPTDFSKQKLPPYLTEGPAWENDKIGFRKYFDTRNANDIWGKTTDKMVLDFVGTNPDSIYHNLSWWGMDILKVGKSLGAGAVALKATFPNGLDTIVRLGANTQQTVYRQIANGPLRAMFSITYKGVKIANELKNVDVIETISISGGQCYFENEVKIFTNGQQVTAVTGIPDFYNCGVDSFTTLKSAALYTHGKQSENKDLLGLAVMLQKKNEVIFSNATQHRSDIANSYLATHKGLDNAPFLYRFYACWQKQDEDFSDKEKFVKFLQQEAVLNESPLEVH